MPVDPEVQARVARLTGADPATLPSPADRIASTARAVAGLGIDSPAVNAAPAAIWATDPDGVVVSWNDMAAHTFGWPAAEVVGHPPPFTLTPAPPPDPPDAPDPGAPLDVGPTAASPNGAAPPATHEPTGPTEPTEPTEPTAPPAEYVTFRRDGEDLHLLLSTAALGDPARPRATVWFATDVTDERSSARALETEHDRWRRLLPSVADVVAIVDEHGVVREINADGGTALGHNPEVFVGASGFALLDPGELDRAARSWDRLLAEPGAETVEVYRTRHADGHYEQVEYTAMNLLADPVVSGIVLISRVVTDRKETQALVTRESEVLSMIAHGAPLAETLAAITTVVESQTGGSAGILLLRPDARELTVGAAGRDAAAPLEVLRRIPLTPSPNFETIDFRRLTLIEDLGADPRTAPFAEHAHIVARSAWSFPVIESRTDELLGLVAVFHQDRRGPSSQDGKAGHAASHLAAIAIERHRWQERLWHQARHDELTGLPNRASILERLDAHIAEQDELDGNVPDGNMTVLFIDIDRFKAVNDSYGHAAGDKLLVRFAGRLRNLAGPADFVGHFGADEFVVLLPDARGEDDARFVANRLELALTEPFALDEGEVYLTASVGVAVRTAGETPAELLQHADAARARAKELGRDRMEVFDQLMRSHADEQLRIDRELRAALAGGQFTLHYQPIIELHSGALAGAEALLRWRRDGQGLVAPAHFLPVAEQTGTITRIGRWVIDEAVRQARQWIDGHPELETFTVAVNLSARELTSPGLAEHVARVLEAHGWPADQLMLELTEGSLITERDATMRIMADLKEVGVRLAIDDFGTGFSSLSELHRFPVDTVKVDPSFVEDLTANGGGSPVTTAVLHMARALGLVVVAEGVERPEQHQGLRTMQCHLAQGFLFAAPAAPDEIERTWLVHPVMQRTVAP